jgi:hypothetical protein
MKPTLLIVCGLLLLSIFTGNVFGQAQMAWVSSYDGPGSGDDNVWEMVVDDAGNVYVTGACGSDGYYDDLDYVVIKYDARGNELWVHTYDYYDTDNYSRGIALDGAGNVYVTGSVYDGVALQVWICTIKLDNDGNFQWSRFWYGPEDDTNARDLAVDESGNVYVTGATYDLSGDYVTIKYDTDGNKIWDVMYDGPAGLEDDPVAIVFDEVGNVYVTGKSEDAINTDKITTVKYDSDGNEVWVDRWGSLGINRPTAMAIDNDGYVYVTGREPRMFTETDYRTIKYDPDGGRLWSVLYDGPGNDNDYAWDIDVDDNGNVYVTGQSTGEYGHYDYATVKYDTDGNELWDARYEGPWGDDKATAISVDGNGNSFVTGYSDQLLDNYDVYTIKYDSSGNEVWAMQFDSADGEDDYAMDIELDGSSNVYVAGHGYHDSSDTDIFTIKYRQSPLIHKEAMQWE